MKKKHCLFAVMGVLLVLSLIGNVVLILPYLRSEESESLSYAEFTDLFDQIDEGLSLDGYQNLGNNDSVQIVAIDQFSSFGKRRYLTLDGAQSNLQTQRRIEYISDDAEEMVVIDLIYLETPLYQDLLYWNDPLWNEENEPIKDIFTDNMLSYKNVLIQISVFSLNGNEESVNSRLTGITQQVVDFLSD